MEKTQMRELEKYRAGWRWSSVWMVTIISGGWVVMKMILPENMLRHNDQPEVRCETPAKG